MATVTKVNMSRQLQLLCQMWENLRLAGDKSTSRRIDVTKCRPNLFSQSLLYWRVKLVRSFQQQDKIMFVYRYSPLAPHYCSPPTHATQPLDCMVYSRVTCLPGATDWGARSVVRRFCCSALRTWPCPF